MTLGEAVTLVTMLAEAYPRDVRETTIEAYAQHLVDLPLVTAQAAVLRLIRTSKWLPTIAEIRKIEAADRLPEIPTVDEAWSMAIQAMSGPGASRVPPVVSRAIGLLGRADQVREAQLSWLRPRFYEAYQRVVQQVEEATAAGYVPEWLPSLCTPEERVRLGQDDILGLEDGRR